MKASFTPLRGGFDPMRRTLLKTGLAGSLLLLVGRSYASTCAESSTVPGFAFLSTDDVVILKRVITVMLRGSLSSDEDQQKVEIGELIDDIDNTVTVMAPATRKEIRDLFNLLNLTVARALLGGLWRPWDRASDADVEVFLANWRNSRFDLLRSVYTALHTLCMGHWYANPGSWARIGYAGPPKLA